MRGVRRGAKVTLEVGGRKWSTGISREALEGADVNLLLKTEFGVLCNLRQNEIEEELSRGRD